MSRLLDQKVTEWGTWYEYNRERIPPENLKKRCDFYQLAISGLIECLAIACKDIQTIERRDAPRIILPKQVSLPGEAPVRLRD